MRLGFSLLSPTRNTFPHSFAVYDWVGRHNVLLRTGAGIIPDLNFETGLTQLCLYIDNKSLGCDSSQIFYRFFVSPSVMSSADPISSYRRVSWDYIFSIICGPNWDSNFLSAVSQLTANQFHETGWVLWSDNSTSVWHKLKMTEDTGPPQKSILLIMTRFKRRREFAVIWRVELLCKEIRILLDAFQKKKEFQALLYANKAAALAKQLRTITPYLVCTSRLSYLEAHAQKPL